jgi:hypothetical protein
MVGTSQDGRPVVTPFDHEYTFDITGYPLGSWSGYTAGVENNIYNLISRYASRGPVQNAIARRRLLQAVRRLKSASSSFVWPDYAPYTVQQDWEERLDDLENILSDPDLEI